VVFRKEIAGCTSAVLPWPGVLGKVHSHKRLWRSLWIPFAQIDRSTPRTEHLEKLANWKSRRNCLTSWFSLSFYLRTNYCRGMQVRRGIRAMLMINSLGRGLLPFDASIWRRFILRLGAVGPLEKVWIENFSTSYGAEKFERVQNLMPVKFFQRRERMSQLWWMITLGGSKAQP